MAIMKFDAPQISWIEPNLSFITGANSILLLDNLISSANFKLFIISLYIKCTFNNVCLVTQLFCSLFVLFPVHRSFIIISFTITK